MKRTFLLLFAATLSLAAAYAQTDPTTTPADTSYWRRSFSGGINISQAAFSTNWAAGGINSLALGAFVNTFAIYQKDRTLWENRATLELGFVRQGRDQATDRKSLDRIFLETKYGYKLAPKWYGIAFANFQSQFVQGFSYGGRAGGGDVKISNFLAPGYLIAGVGIEYKPNDWFSVSLSPFSPRFTFLSDDDVRTREAVGGRVTDRTQTAYGVVAGQSLRTEWLAASIVAQLDRNVAENLNLKARYQGFLNFNSLPMVNRLDVILTAKVNRFVNANLTATVLYDKDMTRDVQWSQGLTIGFLYNVQNFKDKK